MFRKLFFKSKWLLLIVIVTISLLGINKLKQQYKQQEVKKLFESAAKIPAESWAEKYKDMPVKDKYKVVYLTSGAGEYSAFKYFQYAAEKLGWEVKMYFATLDGKADEIISFNPDFIISTLYVRHECFDDRLLPYKKYYWISIPLHAVFKGKDYLNPKGPPYEQIRNYAQGILCCSGHEMDIYRQMWNKKKKPFYGIHMCPLPPSIDYEPAEPKSIMLCNIPGADTLKGSDRYKKFITLLTQNLPSKGYGPYNTYVDFKPGIYKGDIPRGIDNLEAIRKNGIYLSTHGAFHFEGNMLSMRPLEAAAANVIAISDKHPLVMKHFGDSMLYFDQNASGEEIYRQVKEHFDWIMANPEKAKEMANRAHKIFLEKFNLEKDLIRLAKMHEYILQEEKKLNLEYSPAYY
ncbi:hypothetical protein phytr_1940 [Candidatus Phycorickettsia trachydisci]|uniref:Spore protein YkvP/CgeB glycosyl transferase-like domain-containing protein n=1 Tax=Candidatus Phycorickettsia trachydisci TaxID=2115978 RepID=A0A2P1P7A7_9RICK|nr:glycosyltransferase [Candidatus Phycorickettsia trachydisci]AVP87152.1 hypothetical protein phytr_1940 [Candidatus Phycorickettsia trachydisci]